MSWKNVVEKIMCILNLALYGVTLVRSSMGEMETAIKAASGSMASIRAAAAEDEDLLEACKLSIQPVKELLHSRFEKLELKGEEFKTFESASKDELLTLFSFAVIIDQTIPHNQQGLVLKSAQLHHKDRLKHFIQTHMHTRDYFLVVGKYCQHYVPETEAIEKKIGFDCPCKPVKMGAEVWTDLSTRQPLLPDPTPLNGKWLQYSDLVLLRTTEARHQPSLSEKQAPSNIANRKKVIKPETVRGYLQCTDCPKIRCVYNLAAMSADDVLRFTQSANG